MIEGGVVLRFGPSSADLAFSLNVLMLFLKVLYPPGIEYWWVLWNLVEWRCKEVLIHEFHSTGNA